MQRDPSQQQENREPGPVVVIGALSMLAIGLLGASVVVWLLKEFARSVGRITPYGG
jgi:hypothetical protein